jgi:hypothetical protein
VQRRDTTALDGSERALELDTIGDEFVKDVAHRQDRRVLGERSLAPSDDVLDRESHHPRLQPILLPADGDTLTTPRIGIRGHTRCEATALMLDADRFEEAAWTGR